MSALNVEASSSGALPDGLAEVSGVSAMDALLSEVFAEPDGLGKPSQRACDITLRKLSVAADNEAD
jgi:hypothetical protein